MKYPEKKAGARKYEVRRAAVTHGLFALRGRWVAACCADKPCRPRHDDGFTLDPAKVDCDRCKEALQ